MYVHIYARAHTHTHTHTRIHAACMHACIHPYVYLCIKVLDGMLQLQEYKVIHRDLALRNVLAFEFCHTDCSKVRVKLTDYGLATTGTSLSISLSLSLSLFLSLFLSLSLSLSLSLHTHTTTNSTTTTTTYGLLQARLTCCCVLFLTPHHTFLPLRRLSHELSLPLFYFCTRKSFFDLWPLQGKAFIPRWGTGSVTDSLARCLEGDTRARGSEGCLK